jgi:hypothetical protein
LKPERWGSPLFREKYREKRLVTTDDDDDDDDDYDDNDDDDDDDDDNNNNNNPKFHISIGRRRTPDHSTT